MNNIEDNNTPQMSYEERVQQIICPALAEMFMPENPQQIDFMGANPRYLLGVKDAVAIERAVSELLATHAGFSELVLQRAFGLRNITIGDVLNVGPEKLEAFIEPLEGGLPFVAY